MGRAAVIVLALANLGYLAWSTGALAAFDLLPADRAATEPQRLARQIRPERLRIVTRAQEEEEARARARARAQAQKEALAPEPDTTAMPAPEVPTIADPMAPASEPARPPASSP